MVVPIARGVPCAARGLPRAVRGASPRRPGASPRRPGALWRKMGAVFWGGKLPFQRRKRLPTGKPCSCRLGVPWGPVGGSPRCPHGLRAAPVIVLQTTPEHPAVSRRMALFTEGCDEFSPGFNLPARRSKAAHPKKTAAREPHRVGGSGSRSQHTRRRAPGRRQPRACSGLLDAGGVMEISRWRQPPDPCRNTIIAPAGAVETAR